MDAERRRELIAHYREGPDVVERTVAGLGDDDLGRTPADGGWSAREVVHHLADSEMTSAVRLRRLIAEDDPVIHGYDEEEFARRLYYDARPPEASLAALRASRETTASILDRLTDEEWARSGTHSERDRTRSRRGSRRTRRTPTTTPTRSGAPCPAPDGAGFAQGNG